MKGLRLLLIATALLTPICNAGAERKLSGATTLSSRDRVSVVIDREKAPDGTYVVLKITVPTEVKIDAFMLPEPPRIVLDLAGASVKRSGAFAAPLNGVVKQVRLGAHPDKLRVVVDLAKGEAPKYEWKSGKRQVILRMLEAPAAPLPPAVQQPEKKPEAPPAPPAVPAVAPKLPSGPAQGDAATLGDAEPPGLAKAPVASEPSKAQGAQLDSESLKAAAAAPQPAQEAKAPASDAPGTLGAAAASAKLPDQGSRLPEANGLKIVGYRFEHSEQHKAPTLKITLNSGGATAQMSKVDATTYKIVVPKSSLANEDLVLPQFPPADFAGFIMVMSEEVNGAVEVTISVEEGLSLTTMVRGDEIWVLPPAA